MKTMLNLLLVLVSIAWASAQEGHEVSTKKPEDHIRICESQNRSMRVVPIRDEMIRTTLEAGETPSVIIEPSVRAVDTNDTFDARFDYRIVTGADRYVFKISDFGKTPEDREGIKYRRLESIPSPIALSPPAIGGISAGKITPTGLPDIFIGGVYDPLDGIILPGTMLRELGHQRLHRWRKHRSDFPHRR